MLGQAMAFRAERGYDFGEKSGIIRHGELDKNISAT